MKITLTNDFHLTEIKLIPHNGHWLSSRQIKRAQRALCGVEGCTCGGDLGERGTDNPIISVDPNTGIGWIQS